MEISLIIIVEKYVKLFFKYAVFKVFLLLNKTRQKYVDIFENIMIIAEVSRRL